MRSAPVLLVTALLAACGSDPATGAGGGATTSTSTSSTGGGMPTGTGDGDFRKAFSSDGVGVSCGFTRAELEASGAPAITVGNTTLFAGFEQIGDNQDPVLLRFDDDQKVYCEHHEHESPDGRALGITWDGGPKAFVVYTITGGGTAFDSLAKGGWIDHYGDGGGSAKVAVVAEVETTHGTVQRATFVPAKKQNGTQTNTLVPAGAVTVLADGTLELTGNSAFAPLNPDQSVMCVPSTEYPAALDGAMGPSYLAHFAPDLASMLCASTAGCSLVTKPCP